jgi:hypothetical protein
VADVHLRLQDPGAPSGLLEALLEACDGADRGGGIFAWMTVEGARLLLDADTFSHFASESEFQLVIGVDSITDLPALRALEQQVERLAGLSARVFFHELRPILFHSKLSWFVRGDRLTLFTGSGNLTRGGLRTNWEAFTSVLLKGDEAAKVEAQLGAWLQTWNDSLFALDNPRVLARARENSGRERSLKRPVRRADPEQEVHGGEGGEPSRGDEDVLVATIGGGRRWTQANFPRRIYEDFFRARVGTKRHVLFQPVGLDGSLAELQSRESVEVPSENYRFELTAVSGRPYPGESHPPIGVFARSRDGVVRYLVVMPDDADYGVVADFLASEWNGPARELPRVRTTATALRAAWPTSPLWRAVE